MRTSIPCIRSCCTANDSLQYTMMADFSVRTLVVCSKGGIGGLELETFSIRNTHTYNHACKLFCCFLHFFFEIYLKFFYSRSMLQSRGKIFFVFFSCN